MQKKRILKIINEQTHIFDVFLLLCIFHRYWFGCFIFDHQIRHLSAITIKIQIEQMGCNQSQQASAPQAQPIIQKQAPKSKSTPLETGNQYDTIVIGGGLAGVTAAVELAKAGQNVVVLEANGYLGGRLKTRSVQLTSGDELQFDEGASWIHGSSQKHPITKLSKKVEGLVMKQTDDDSAQVYDEGGNQVDDQAGKAFQVYQQLLEKCEKQQPQNSMEQAFAKLGGNVLNDKYFMFNVSNDVEFQTSGPISKLAASGLDDDQYQGKQMLILSGYQRFVDTQAEQAEIQVHLNQKIKKVKWNQQKNQVQCANGITIYSTNVVIAVPIGVLKSNGIVFEPALPEWKKQAINSIGFGNVCKILLDFPNMDFLGDTKSHYIGVVSNNIKQRGLGTYFLNLNAIAGVNALMTFGLGDNADQAQNMSEGDLKRFLAKRITAFSEEQVKPEDFKLYKTGWRGDQNFKGTYAYASTSTREEHWQNMAKPVFDSSWYFCGEHTTSKYRGTVHGAYLSGVHAANYITKQVEEEGWKYPDWEQGQENESDE